MTIADEQQSVASGIDGMNITQNIENRAVPMKVRYQRDFRDSPKELGGVLIATPTSVLPSWFRPTCARNRHLIVNPVGKNAFV